MSKEFFDIPLFLFLVFFFGVVFFLVFNELELMMVLILLEFMFMLMVFMMVTSVGMLWLGFCFLTISVGESVISMVFLVVLNLYEYGAVVKA